MRQENCKHIAFRSDWDHTYLEDAACIKLKKGYPKELDCEGCKEFEINPLMEK